MIYRLMFLAAVVSVASAGQAQTATPTQAAPGLGGPVVVGVCMLSREAVIANAKIGQAATARLRVITQEAQAEVNAERKPIEADVQAFNAEAAKLSVEQRQTRQQALAIRLQPVEAKAAQRGREIEATRAKALTRISAELQPVAAQVYRQRGCGLLVDRNTVIGGNMTNDLTQSVVQGLDAKISTMTFNREALPAIATTQDGAR